MEAVATIETSLNAMRAEASVLAPTEFRRVESRVSELKNALARSDYKAVVDAAPAVSRELSALEGQVATRRAGRDAALNAAAERWKALSIDVPQIVAAIEVRVQPAGQPGSVAGKVPAARLQSAREELQAIQTAWVQAMAMFNAGNATDAVTRGQAVKEKGAEVLRQLDGKEGEARSGR